MDSLLDARAQPRAQSRLCYEGRLDKPMAWRRPGLWRVLVRGVRPAPRRAGRRVLATRGAYCATVDCVLPCCSSSPAIYASHSTAPHSISRQTRSRLLTETLQRLAGCIGMSYGRASRSHLYTIAKIQFEGISMNDDSTYFSWHAFPQPVDCVTD